MKMYAYCSCLEHVTLNLPLLGMQPASAGVLLSTGEEMPAVMVVDTSGAKSKLAVDFLRARGVSAIEKYRVDPGLGYYTRYFQLPLEVDAWLYILNIYSPLGNPQ